MITFHQLFGRDDDWRLESHFAAQTCDTAQHKAVRDVSAVPCYKKVHRIDRRDSDVRRVR